MAIVMGVVPTLFLQPMEPAVARMVERVQGAQPARVKTGATRRTRHRVAVAHGGTPACRTRGAAGPSTARPDA